MKQIVKRFERDDLPNDELKILSDAIGINQVKALLIKCPGQRFYIPKSVYKQMDLNYIRKNPGKTPQEIAEVLGIGLRTAYRKRAAVK